MAKILAIDPGNEYSAYVLYKEGAVLCKGKHLNADVWAVAHNYGSSPDGWVMAIEMPACYGMAVGETVFDTCRWVGIFQDTFGVHKTHLVYRKARNKEDGIEGVCMHICKNNRAKDSNIRQAIIDRYPATGGGKTPQIGTKAQPGPLYGVSADIWAALAVAITFSETYHESA
jgi:hypothetical protein